ncbi:MAG TPA: sterol desaturase family protein [Planctomycetota bacterium]|nr:sterol desaturase family protein [Planctomycetota bacterium]
MSAAAPRQEDRRFGSGWISGAISAVLGPLAFGAVLCLRFPQILTSPHLREIYPMGLVRGLIHVSLVASFVLGVVSVSLRSSKLLGGAGILFPVLGTLLGGSEIAVDGPVRSSAYLGLDWFILDLFLLAVLFVPMERLFSRRDQPVFRPGWTTDLAHFLVSHVAVQLLMLLTLTPATVLFRFLLDGALQRAVSAQPGWIQFLEIVLLADLAEYWTHRLFHRVGFLWKFHAIHHSSQSMDWLAGSRLHLVDIVITRALAFVPLYALGFSRSPVYAYLVFVGMHAVFLHANVRFRFGRLAQVIGTPRFHHWHHSPRREALNRNFAIHLPVLDRVFGTLYLPGEDWPESYGIEGNPVPEGYGAQLVHPFRRPQKE